MIYRYLLHTQPHSSMQSLVSKPARQNSVYLKKLHEHYAAHESKITNFSLVTVMGIAVFEEIIFRGYLVTLCLTFPVKLAVPLLAITIVLFGLSHASFGWHQVVGKTLLGGCCMAVTLLFGSILPAVIIHGYLNWCAYYSK